MVAATRSPARTQSTHLLLALDERLYHVGVALLHGDEQWGGQRRVCEVDVTVGGQQRLHHGQVVLLGRNEERRHPLALGVHVGLALQQHMHNLLVALL